MAAGNKFTRTLIDRIVDIMDDYMDDGEFFNDPNGDNLEPIRQIKRGDITDAQGNVSTNLWPMIRVFVTGFSPELVYTQRHEHDVAITFAVMDARLDIATVETAVWDYTDELIHFIFTESLGTYPVRKWRRNADSDIGVYDTVPAGGPNYFYGDPETNRYSYRSETNVIIRRAKATL